MRSWARPAGVPVAGGREVISPGHEEGDGPVTLGYAHEREPPPPPPCAALVLGRVVAVGARGDACIGTVVSRGW